MPRICPSCDNRFGTDRAVCPSCKRTHPSAVEGRRSTVSRRQGRARATNWDSAPAKYLRNMKIVNYLAAAPLFALAVFAAGTGTFGVLGELSLSRYDPPARATLSEAVAFVTETAAVSDAVGPFATLTAVAVVSASIALLFVALGFGIKHGYQLGWMANIVLYVAGPLLVGGLAGQFLLATLLVILLPTTWWPIVGRGAVNFDPSLWAEPRELAPALLGEYRRLVTYPL